MNHPEYAFQQRVCRYLDLVHPDILYYSDVRAAVKLNEAQAPRLAALQKRGAKWPDMFLLFHQGGIGFLELKAESPYKRNGSLKAGAHLAAQDEFMRMLKKSYNAEFAGFCWPEGPDHMSIVRRILTTNNPF